MYLRAWSMAAEPAGLGPMATSSRRSAHARLESNLGAAAACTAARAIAITSLVVIFYTGAGAPPPARTDADTEPRSHSPRLGVAAGALTGTGVPTPSAN